MTNTTTIRYYVSPAPTIRGWYVKKVALVDGRECDGGILDKYNTKRQAKQIAGINNRRLKRMGRYVAAQE